MLDDFRGSLFKNDAVIFQISRVYISKFFGRRNKKDWVTEIFSESDITVAILYEKMPVLSFRLNSNFVFFST